MATVDAAWAIAFERRSGILAPGRPADIAILRPVSPNDDPFAAAIDPATRVDATFRGGRLIAGSIG
jgi:imidazolonepropionase-like amidohydrolase